MIITESENGDSKLTPTILGEGSVVNPESPPPYSPSSAFPSAGDTNSLHNSSNSPASSSYGNSGPIPPVDLPPPINYLIHRRSNDDIKGVWHLDTAMPIPDGILVPPEDFDGLWNEADQEARKRGNKGEGRNEDPPTLAASHIRPNLMLQSKNGSINATVHVRSGNGSPRPALIVGEGYNGSVALEVRTYGDEPVRIHAISRNGAVRVRIPQTFQGVVILHTKHGSVRISGAINSRMTTFSASETTRGYIGDWHAVGFGTSPETSSSDPNDDPPLPSLADPFSTWTGPLVHVSSHNGSVHLSYASEDAEPDESEYAGWRGFMPHWFGGTDRRSRGPAGPWGGARHPWGDSQFPWGDSKFPWGDSKFPWGDGAPWSDGQGPNPTPNPNPTPTPRVPHGRFVRGPAPFARGGGPWARGPAAPR